MTRERDELEVIDPASESIDYLGERLEVRPLQIGVLPGLIREARGLINAVLDSGLDESGEGLDVEIVLTLLEQHGSSAFSAAALLTGRDPAWIAQGNPAEFIRLVQTLVRVNRDFFTQSVAPLLASRQKPVAGTGATPSSS